jgi:hypothetical protein
MLAREMMAAHPAAPQEPEEPLVRFIEEAFTCAQACIACADACLAEMGKFELVQCIRLNADCADTCETLGRLASRRTGLNRDVLRGAIEVCALACERCAEECERHAARHRHCAICAEACRRCAEQCRITMESFG